MHGVLTHARLQGMHEHDTMCPVKGVMRQPTWGAACRLASRRSSQRRQQLAMLLLYDEKWCMQD